MTGIKYITRSTTRSKTQTPARGGDPAVAADEEPRNSATCAIAEADDEPSLPLPKSASPTASSSKPAGETALAVTNRGTQQEPTKIKKIILRLPPPRVLQELQTLPVDIIISDMTDANGGIPPSSAEVLTEAIKWFKHAYRTGTSPRIVRSAAERILEQLNTVIIGNPAYRHNIPRGMAYERLEVQRKFLRAIIHIHYGMLNSLEVFDMIVARD